MPSEAPTCPACGSTDVQEVKPGTYFCNYSETVFKYVDPSRLRVEHSPAFCWCGNPIQVQCQLCKTEMCLQCDVGVNRAAIYRSPGTRFGYGPNRDTMSLYGPGAEAGSFDYHSYSKKGEKNVLPVPVSGFGYLHRDMDRRICGPFLYLSELLSTMAVTQGLHYTRDMIPAEHLCFACVAAVVPATAERLANREICESPGCTDQPSKICGCCGNSFCADCVTWPAYANLGSALWPKRRSEGPDQPRYLFRHIFCTLNFGYVYLPRPEGSCLPCLGEAIDKASGLAMRICEQEYQLRLTGQGDDPNDLQPKGSVLHYEMPEIMVATKKARKAEISRQYETSARYAKELTERMENYVKNSPCQLQEAFRDKKYYASYAILDERGRTAPAALTGPADDRGDRGSRRGGHGNSAAGADGGFG
jgi:hypothetical protein